MFVSALKAAWKKSPKDYREAMTPVKIDLLRSLAKQADKAKADGRSDDAGV